MDRLAHHNMPCSGISYQVRLLNRFVGFNNATIVGEIGYAFYNADGLHIVRILSVVVFI
jgi:hypothetical protein